MRIAVIGCGSIGCRHIANLLALGERDLIGCDERPSVCAEVHQVSGVPMTTMPEELWDWKPEIVFICTPPDSHAALVHEAAWQHVKGVFVEKPLGLKPVAEDWLRSLTSPDGPITMVGCNWRFAGGPIQISRWLQEGVLGEVLSARLESGYGIDDRMGYKRSYVARTGATLDVGSHLVDLVLDWFGDGHLLGAAVRPAVSIGLPKMDGSAHLLIGHDCGITSCVSANLIQRHYSHTCEITGREGVIGYDFSREHIYSRLWGQPYQDIRWQDQPDMLVSELEYFLTCVREGRLTCNPISQAARTHRILMEALSWPER